MWRTQNKQSNFEEEKPKLEDARFPILKLNAKCDNQYSVVLAKG